jgi:UDP-N-acetylmuramate--alanine ligase
MLNPIDFSGKPFHFIGIGGIGMSALAYVLAKRKIPVSGSDIRLSHITQRLQENGAHIFWTQDAANLQFFQTQSSSCIDASSKDHSTLAESFRKELVSTPASSTLERSSSAQQLPQVVCSTAISDNNAEYRAALELGCPIFHRSDVLAELIRTHQSVAIAGTHGKTTTSSMVGYILLHAQLDPTIVIGGEVSAWEGNARVGQSRYLVAEADESDGSLVKLAAQIGVITNIELDHPDHYSSLEEVISIFRTFADQCKTVIGCADCRMIEQSLSPDITYSLDAHRQADYWVDQVHYSAQGTTAQVWERGSMLGKLSLQVLGSHNLSNALAAVAVGRSLGIEFSVIAEALARFEGARRRFEHRGEGYGISFIDDYAHHPSEIRATLAAARLRHSRTSDPLGRVVAVFQPHRYSRTLRFLDEFAESFADADLVISTDIYAASEPDLGQVNGQQLAEAIALHHPNVVYQPSLAQVASFLKESLQSGDMVLFLGAGNLNQIIPELVDFYRGIEHHIAESSSKPA